MRAANPLDRARAAFTKAVTKAEVDNRKHATVGWRKSATEAVFTVPGRPGHIYVTVAGQTVYPALNRANVPHQPFLPVWVVMENDQYVIVARDNSNAGVLANVPDSVYGVPSHPLSTHSDVTLTSLADGEVLEWDATAGVWVNAASGAVDSVNGQTGTVVLDADDIDDSATTHKFASAAELTKLAGIEAGANLYVHPNHSGDVTSAGDGATTIANDAVTNAKAANMAADTIKGRANGAGTGDPTDLTATQVRTILNVEDGADVTDAANIAAAISGASTDDTIADADVWGYLTGGTLVKTAWSNIKATLKTYFDTLYTAINTAVLLTGDQTVAGIKTFSSNVIASVIRLAANTGELYIIGGTSSTDGPYVLLIGKDAGGAADGIIAYVSSTESSALGDHVWQKYDGSTATTLMRLIAATRRLGVNMDAPLGPLHVFDGTSVYYALLTAYGVVGSEVTLIPDGTGDVANGCQVHGFVRGSSGAITYFTHDDLTRPGAGSVTFTAADIVFKLYSTGQLVVYRGAGAETWIVAAHVTWL